MSSIKVNVRSKVRLTSTGQTTFVKKVVLGTPVRSVIADITTNINNIQGVNTTGKQDGELLVFDSAENVFKAFTLEGSNGLARTYTPASDKIGFKIDSSSSPKIQNLTVSGDIVPAADSASSLGTASKKFKNLFLSGDTIRLGTLVLRDSNGGLGVRDTANAPKPIGLRGARQQIRSFFAAGGDLSYNPVTGIFSLDVETVYTKANFDSDLGAALSGGAGITYDSSTDTISITNTGVTPGTYGSASQVPQIVVNPKGQILSVSNVSIAGVTGITFDSSNGALTVSTSAGTSFTDSINLNPFSTTNLSEGSNLYFTSGRADARVNAGFSAKSTTDLSEGTNLYFTTARADSDAKNAISGGTGIGYNSITGVITTNDGQIVHDNLSGFVADEHVAHGGVSIVAGKGLSGGGTIASSRTIDIDSANVRGMFSGSNGISYTSGTGDIRAPQPLDSAANPTFNQLRGPATFIIDPAAIGDSTGTVRILGNLTVEGATTTINSTTVSIDDKNIQIADSAADSAGLDGGGITWGGSSITNTPKFNYSHSNARFEANRPINASSFIGNVTGNVSGTAASVTNAAQTNITSVGNLTALRVDGEIDARNGITNNEGALILQSSSGASIQFKNHANNIVMRSRSDGVAELRHNGNTKLITRDSGAEITGYPLITAGALGTTAGNTLELLDIRATQSNTSKLRVFTERDANGTDWTSAFTRIQQIIDVTEMGYIQFNGQGEGRGMELGTEGDEKFIKMVHNGAVELYHNDSKKFETTSSGASVTGTLAATLSTAAQPNITSLGTLTGLTSTGDVAIDSAGGFLFDVSDKALELGDNYKITLPQTTNALQFGTSNGSGGVDVLDLNNENITGVNRIKFADAGVNEGLDFNSRIKLYEAPNDLSNAAGNLQIVYNNTRRFTVSDSGAEVVGELNVDSATASGNLRADGGRLILGNDEILTGGSYLGMKTSNQSGNDEYMIISGVTDGNTYLSAKASNNVYIRGGGNTNTHQIQVGTSYARAHGDFQFDSGGAIQFDKSDKALEFGDNYKATFGAGADLAIFHDAGNSAIIDQGTGGLFIRGSSINIDDTSSNDYITATEGGAVTLFHNGSSKLATTSTGATVTGTINADSATFTNATISNISNAPIFKAVGGNEGGEINLERAPNSSLDGGTYNRTVIDMNVNKFRIFTNGSARGAHLNLSTMDSNSVGTNEIVTEQTSHSFTKSQFFRNDVVIDSAGGFLFDISDKALELGDNYKSVFGAGGDLEIFHDGSNSRIKDVGTGSLIVTATNLKFSKADGTEDYINCVVDDTVELFFNGSKKFETTDSGAKVTGQIVADSATMTLATITGLGVGSTSEALNPVSGQLAVGGARLRDWSSASTDIDALIEGSNFGNIIEGRLNAHLVLGLRNNDATDGVSIISSDSSYGTNSLYTNHVVSFKADGDIEIDSAGAIMYDKSDKALKFGDNYKAKFGAGGDLEIYHDGSNSYIDEGGTGNLYIRAGGNNNISLTDNAVYLYYSGSTKLQTTNTGVSVTGKITSSDSALFDGNGSSGGVSISDGLIDIRTGTGNVSKVKFYCEASNAHFQTLQAAPHSAGSSAVIVLPTASGTLLNENGSAANLTQIPMAQASGTLAAANVGNLPASKITSGVFDSARLPTGTFGGAGGGEANQNAFSTISVAGQSDVVADAATDTVTFVAGSNMTITTNASGDTVTFTSSGGGGGGGGGLDSAAVLTVIGTSAISGVSGNFTVSGALSATTKSFDIEHPTQNGKRLRYGSLEGPENGVYVRGRIQGINKIKLPDHWTGLVDEETITVNLTPIGFEQCLFVKNIQNYEIEIDGGQNIDCFYTVYGERKDVDKLRVEYES